MIGKCLDWRRTGIHEIKTERTGMICGRFAPGRKGDLRLCNHCQAFEYPKYMGHRRNQKKGGKGSHG